MARFVGEPPEPFGMGIYPRYEDLPPLPEPSPERSVGSIIGAWFTLLGLLLVSLSPWIVLTLFVWLR